MFDMKPMTVEHNDIMIRGTNPHGHSTTWGIYGSPYTTGNYIHGDDANPAGNSVQQIGMFMGVPDNSTQSDNTFERLDKGIEASVDYSGTRERDISGNLFRDVVAGISFYTYIAGAMSPSRLFVRCNSFENPGSLAGAVALNMEGPNFSSALGSSVTGNGNRFVTTGLPFIEPIINVAAPFIYYAFNGSAQENFSLATSAGYSVALTGGSLSTACSGAGYSNGINNRSATTASISSEELQHAYDSLRLKDIGAARRYALMNTLVTVAEQRKDFTTLEAYMATLPDFANEVHKSLGSWLLHAYYTEHRPADAQRMQAVLLARHPADPEARSFVLLTDALLRISRPAAPLDPAAVAALRQVAASGTPSARVACPIARLYDPTCPCHFSAKGASTALAAPDVAGSMNSLGMGTPYPNPANESISIPYTVPVGQGSVQLELHNALGQLVYRMPLSQGMDEAKITIGQLASGLYQVVLVSNGQHVVTRRLAVAH